MSLEQDERQAIAVLKAKRLTQYEIDAIARFTKGDKEDPDYKLTPKQRTWLLQLFAKKTQSRRRF